MGILSKIFTWWDGQTYGTQLFTARKGVKVGEDAAGNVYYRTRDDSRRWVIYNGEVEGSRVAPEWNGWLQRTWDQPPTERPFAHKPWEKPHLPNLTGTAAAYRPAGALERGGRRAAATGDYQAWTPDGA